MAHQEKHDRKGARTLHHRLGFAAVSWLTRVPRGYVAAGILSAALLVLSFPPYSVVALAFIGLVPLLVAAFRAPTYREAAWAGFSCMVSFIVLGLSWISFVATNFGGLPWIVGKIVLMGFACFAEPEFLGLSLVVFAGTTWLNKRNASKAIHVLFLFVLVPLIFIGFDVWYPKIFPITLGQALYRWFAVAQIAEYSGVYGLTIPIMLSNMALALVAVHFLRKRWPDLAERTKRLPALATAATVVALLSLGLWAADGWGKRRIAELQNLERSYTREFRFSIIQGNIGDVDKLASEKGFEPAVNLVLNTYREMTMKSVIRFRPDLVIWPETSYPYLYTHMKDLAANRSGAARDRWIADLLGEIRTPIYFGAYSNVDKRDYNTGFLVRPPFELEGFYRKSILLAFGEYVPLGPLSSIVQDAIPTIANFGKGQGPMVLSFSTPRAGIVKLGPQICYEGIVPEFSRESARLGAEVLFNITNDSWFGRGSEAELHLLLTVFRSIELRRPMIRGTNTGISTWVDMTGATHGATRLFEPAVVEDTIRLAGRGQRLPETFFLRHGALFGNFCAALAQAALVALAAPYLVQLTAARRRRKKLKVL